MNLKNVNLLKESGFEENEFRSFTCKMRQKLLDNRKKGRGWLNDSSDGFMLIKLQEEVSELVLAIHSNNSKKGNSSKNVIDVMDEAADVANIAMMIYLRAEKSV